MNFTRLRGVLVLASTLALSACASDGSSPGSSVEDETGAPAQQETWDLGDDFASTTAERFCLDLHTSAFCDEAGTGHGLPQACEDNEVCSAVSGYCGLTACEPGSVSYTHLTLPTICSV